MSQINQKKGKASTYVKYVNKELFLLAMDIKCTLTLFATARNVMRKRKKLKAKYASTLYDIMCEKWLEEVFPIKLREDNHNGKFHAYLQTLGYDYETEEIFVEYQCRKGYGPSFIVYEEIPHDEDLPQSPSF